MRRAAAIAPRRSVLLTRPSSRRGIQAAGPGSVAGWPARGGCATYSTVSPGLGRPQPELPRKQRVGGLIRRQVRRDVNDVQVSLAPAVAAAELRERDRLGAELLRRERQEPLQPIAEGVELACGPIVGTAADDGFARVEEQVEHRLARAREVARERDHVFERRVGRPQPAKPQQPQDAQQPLGRVRPRRARVGVLKALGQPPVQAGARRAPPAGCWCRHVWRCRRRESRA